MSPKQRSKALPNSRKIEKAVRLLSAIPYLDVRRDESLARHTRFEIGGPAQLFIDARSPQALQQAIDVLKKAEIPVTVIGGGSNLVVNDAGFAGAIVRYVANEIEFDGPKINVAAGALLQDLVDGSIGLGLHGIHTMTGIPGWVGGAIYGNAGAYGNSIQQFVESVRFFDGETIREITNAECEFEYRESIFKRQKDWIILSADLRLGTDDADILSEIARAIRKTRDEKFPPTMRCAGSIFKNLFAEHLPPAVVAAVPPTKIRDGKIPSAYFLEAAGAKGQSNGPIRVAAYHANLIYNTGGGTAAQVHQLVNDLKKRVQDQFGITLEEEVQYV